MAHNTNRQESRRSGSDSRNAATISTVISTAFAPPSRPGAVVAAKKSNYPYRLHLRLNPREVPFKFEGLYEKHQEVYVDLSSFDECVPGLYAGTIVDTARDVGLYEVVLTTGFVVMVMERVIEPKELENWKDRKSVV